MVMTGDVGNAKTDIFIKSSCDYREVVLFNKYFSVAGSDGAVAGCFFADEGRVVVPAA